MFGIAHVSLRYEYILRRPRTESLGTRELQEVYFLSAKVLKVELYGKLAESVVVISRP